MKASMLLSLILAGMLLASVFLVGLTSSAGVYNPWYDLDDDGDIDIFDIVKMAGIYGTSGEPFEAKSAIEYDSGWINITDKRGQSIAIAHNLNSADLIVDIQGRRNASGGWHQILLGGDEVNYELGMTYGTITGCEGANAIIQTADGGYALAGFKQPVPSGSLYGFWLVKTDANLTMQWNQTYRGTDSGQAHALLQTADGGYALVGSTYSETTHITDAWLVKTDAEGTMQWNKTYGGAEYDYAYDLVQTSDEGYALVGRTDSFGASGEGYGDVWLIKTDSSGNHLWNKTYDGGGSVSPDCAWALVQTTDDGYALAGHTHPSETGGWDFWLIKTDSSGNHLWNETYGGTGSDLAYDLVQMSDGGYTLAGCTDSFGAGHEDSWLVRTDSLGNHLWNKTYGGASNDYTWALVEASDGGYALAGYTYSPTGRNDAWLVKTDAEGTMQWNKTYGGAYEDCAYDLVQAGDGGYAVVGITYSYGDGNGDSWLVKTDPAGAPFMRYNCRYGLVCVDSTENTITLARGAYDIYWNFVRVRVWKIKE